MKRLSIALLLLSSTSLWPQAWSAFLDPSRAIDWTTIGFSIPNYTVNCSTQPSLATGSGSASANATSINNSILSCDATHNVVSIPAGTWYFTTILVQKDKVVIRGAGPGSTDLIPTVGTGCTGGLTDGICLMNSNNIYAGSPLVAPPSGTQQCLWTAGFSQGTTSITLSSCGGAPPSGSVVILDQANDTTDNNGIYICDTNTINCGVEGTTGGNNNGRFLSGATHSQQQLTKITGVTSLGGGSYTVTISPGVTFTNVRTGNAAGAWWFTSNLNNGIENLTIDGSTMSSGAPTNFGNIGMYQCYQCWVKNVRSENAGRNHIETYQSFQDVIRDSYFYGALGSSSQSYGIEIEEASGLLVENNIFQQTTAPIIIGAGSGSVFDYNFSLDDWYDIGGAYGQAVYFSHNAGNEMNLFEGNNFVIGPWGDDSWGATTQVTVFRSMSPGWYATKTAGTTPIITRALVRAINSIGGVYGQPGYHTTYQTYATSTSALSGSEHSSIYSIGLANEDSCSSGSKTTCDPLVVSTLMRWGNYDTVNAATQWNSTEASPGAVSYVNANFSSSYFTSLAHTLPASLYYSSTPPWWTSGKAWPAIGPDVTTGNVGICSGGTYAGAQATSSGQCTGGTLSAAWASHVTSLPAQDCYLNTMGGPPDGSGSVLSFDAAACYATTNFTFTVTKIGTGTIGGTNCSTGSYASGTAINCTAAYSSGWVFTGWGGACSGMGTCSFSLTSNSAVTATFVATTAQYLNIETATAATTPNTSSPGWNINNQPADTGGVNSPASQSQTNGQSSPAGGCTSTSQKDTLTTIATSTQTNVLFWYYGTGDDGATNFVEEACIYVTNIAAANNIEIDFDQYNATQGKLHSFGHQYNIASGCWQYANNSSGWQTTAACPAFAGNTWHDVIWTGHQTASTNFYDSLTFDGATYPINATLTSEPLGVLPMALIPQVQIDAAPTTGTAATVSYNVDDFNFSAYSVLTPGNPFLTFGP